ncbi:MAG: hypothetical protein IPM54_38940 [Polyangiaceae bacterium]|nr:hypothetical protein [Polyangiaceae bacterium]
MPTFLTTPKMSPELTERVEASVAGRPAGRAKMSPTVVAVLRFVGIAAVVGIVALLVVERRRAVDALEADRNALLSQLHESTAHVTAADKALLPRIEAWVGEHSGDYEGDIVDESLRGEGMTATLARPILYLRGPIGGFKSLQGLADMGQTTFRDAFVLCLFDPPAKATEKTLREAARAVLSDGERIKVAAHVERFHTARAGLPFLMPQWEERVRTVDDSRALAELRNRLKRVNLEDTVRALKARLFLVVMDEPKDGNGPTEIDGANRHYVRVVLLDLETNEVLLRQRKLVDPAWIPTNRRSEHANGINSCELGMEVRAAMTGSVVPARQ